MVKAPLAARLLLPGATWCEKKAGKNVYVTFDDGPIPEVTPWVLDEADKWNAKLTFFCVGENVHKHPDLFQEIIRRGHQVGNHTYNHIRAWKTNRKEYFQNIEKAAQYIDSKLFRPPYGEIYPWYVSALKQSFNKVVMWDVLSKDYDNRLSGEQVSENVKQYMRPGSIIVFHDSLKAEKNMKYAFPKTLEMIAEKGFIPDIL